MDRLIGARISDVAIEAVVGEGGFGVVYRGRDASGRGVAIKVLHRELAAAPEAVARFEREIETVQWVRHPNVVDVLGVGRLEDGRPYLVMELLEGADLAATLEEDGRFDVSEAVPVLRDVCAALTAAHERGVIHRDIKASNVFIERGSGRVVLLDFGIAKILAPGHTITATQQAIGTPAAMAPEQYAGRAVDARTDVYGVGALAYHLLTGQPPFAEESTTLLRYLHCHAERPRASQRAPVSGRVDHVITRAMHTDPRRRFPSTAELFSALERAVSTIDDCVAPLVEVVLVPTTSAPAVACQQIGDALERGIACFAEHGFVVEVSGSRALWMSPQPPSDDATGRARLAARELRASVQSDTIRVVINVAGANIE